MTNRDPTDDPEERVSRIMANWHFTEAMKLREAARWCFRNGGVNGRYWMRQALRELRNFRWHRERIAQ